MRLKDKVAIVTGVDAGSIGQATALMFAEAGAKVVVMAGGERDGIETVALIRKGGGEALLLNLEMAKERDVKQACEDTIRAFGRLDILINNDALFVPQRIRYAAEAMKQQGKGAIVNTVTLSGLRPQSYSTTQATLMQMARDLAPDNIRVNCVCHGAVRSVTSLDNIGRAGQVAEDLLAGESSKDFPNRMGTPRDVAFAILFLASDEASFITGASLLVDGGHFGTVKSSFEQHISSRVASFS